MIFFMAVVWLISRLLFVYSVRHARRQATPPLSRLAKNLMFALVGFDILFAAAYFGHYRDNSLLIIFLIGNLGLIGFILALHK